MGLILENAFKEDPQESQLLLTENKSKKNSAWKYSTYKKEGGSPTFFVFFFFFPQILISETEFHLVFILDKTHVPHAYMCFLSLSSLFKSHLNSAQILLGVVIHVQLCQEANTSWRDGSAGRFATSWVAEEL